MDPQWGFAIAGLGIALLTFIWKVYTDANRQRNEECEQCLQERKLLKLENRKLQEQVFELMLAAIEGKG